MEAYMDDLGAISFHDFMTHPPATHPIREMTAADEAALATLDWDALEKREPLLVTLAESSAAIVDTGGPTFCANHVWSHELKPQLLTLVGWEAETDEPVLRSTEAYDIAYRACYNLLPGCRGCWCLPAEEDVVHTE